MQDSPRAEDATGASLPDYVHDSRGLAGRLRRRERTERQSFLIAEGRSEGRLSARYRGANFPRTRTDGALLPDFRGVLETDDGATVLFAWHGYAIPRPGSKLELVGSLTHVTDDERYRRLNDAFCALAGEVRPRVDGSGYEVVLDVAELVWEPIG